VADLTNTATVGAVSFMRDLIHQHKVSPEVVTTSDEEVTRHMFGTGRAIFMRNWPYAWVLLQRDGSSVQGKVGIAPLPTFGSHPHVSTLGGWHLGIAKNSQHPEEAWTFIEFLTSYHAQQVMALQVGIQASRTAVYQDQELNAAQPFLADLQPMLFSARPRPVTPFYPMVSQILQSEFSAVLANVRDPHVAMRSAEQQINHALGKHNEKHD
jgi:multiple sugar transport system substrate-binding protein